MMDENTTPMAHKVHILDLCDSLLLKIFSYLTHPTRAKCACVCKRFYEISKDNALFRKMSPVRWSSGLWDPSVEVRTGTDQSNLFAYHNYLQQLVDTGINEELNTDIERYLGRREFIFFLNMTTQILPCYGQAVRHLNLSYSNILDDDDISLLLIQCPNITDLDVSHCWKVHFRKLNELDTFDACRQLKNINLSNCSVDDNSILLLTKCWLKTPEDIVTGNIEPRIISTKFGRYNTLSGQFQGEVSEVVAPNTFERQARFSKVAGLRSLNLSGCVQLTDTCLGHLKTVTPILSKLKTLDLSGCYKFTGKALKDLVSVCPCLQGKNIAYCDHITDGPFVKEASGCQNLQQQNCCVTETK